MHLFPGTAEPENSSGNVFDYCRIILIIKWSEKPKPYPRNVPGDFYVEDGCCTACDVPFYLSRLQIIGIDLAGMFRELPRELKHLQLVETSVENFHPTEKFDLITCVHGLHYIGDKLGTIQKAANWLKADGMLLANLDLNNLKLAEKRKLKQNIFQRFKKAGIYCRKQKTFANS